jgi:hypothetical protein
MQVIELSDITHELPSSEIQEATEELVIKDPGDSDKEVKVQLILKSGNRVIVNTYESIYVKYGKFNYRFTAQLVRSEAGWEIRKADDNLSSYGIKGIGLYYTVWKASGIPWNASEHAPEKYTKQLIAAITSAVNSWEGKEDTPAKLVNAQKTHVLNTLRELSIRRETLAKELISVEENILLESGNIPSE